MKLVFAAVAAMAVFAGCSTGDTGFVCNSTTLVVTSDSCTQIKTTDKCDSTSYYTNDAGTPCCNFTNCATSPGQ